MLNISKYLLKELKKITPRVYNEKATKDAKFPYVVFNSTVSNSIEKDREDIILEINIWDYMSNGYDAYISIETLTDKIDKFLRKNRHIDENQLLIFERINRLSIPDTDENVRRRELRYVIKYYDRNQ